MPANRPPLTAERKAWLASLKAGDEVAVITEYGGIHPAKVLFATARRIGLTPGGHGQYRLGSGARIADASSRRRAWIVPLDESIRRVIVDTQRHRELSLKFVQMTWVDFDKLTLAQLEAIAAIVAGDGKTEVSGR